LLDTWNITYYSSNNKEISVLGKRVAPAFMQTKESGVKVKGPGIKKKANMASQAPAVRVKKA
jgi:hypothetical protein